MARTGRPRSFDREAALTSAMHLFWEHGYEGTSLDRLRREMGGISSASLYAAFGSKAALYEESLRQYLATHGQVLAILRDESVAPRDRIECALRGSARMQTNGGHPSGCMVALSATICSSGSSALQALTVAERAANRATIRQCVLSAVDAGELRRDANVTGLVAMVDGLLNGLSVQARDGVSRADLEAGISAAMQAWDANGTHRGPPPSSHALPGKAGDRG